MVILHVNLCLVVWSDRTRDRLVLTSKFALHRSDPVRPFISGHVANSMAAEVIALLHSLLTAPESNTAQIWTSTAEKVKDYYVYDFITMCMLINFK